MIGVVSCSAAPVVAQGIELPGRRVRQCKAVAHRRRALLAIPALMWAVARQPAQAAENAGGVDSASSPLIQELLRRTEEKKEDRRKERLDDYYRRNFEDYFNAMPPERAGQGSENQQRIQAWLQEKQEPLFPKLTSGETFPAQE